MNTIHLFRGSRQDHEALAATGCAFSSTAEYHAAIVSQAEMKISARHRLGATMGRR